MSRTESKIIAETEFWIAIFKEPQLHSDKSATERAALSDFSAVHRLDYETQGLLLLARKDVWEKYHALFSEKQSEKQSDKDNLTEKIYLAGAKSEVHPDHYDGFVGSRYRSSKKTRFAIDRSLLIGYRAIQTAAHDIEKVESPTPFSGYAHKVKLLSGRRHQIRSFFACFDAPLLGDSLYNPESDPQKNLELFSWKLNFVDPMTEKKVELEAPLNLFQTKKELLL